MWRLLLTTAIVLLASSGSAEIYHCADSSGRSSFTNDPTTCAQPVPIPPLREITRQSPPARRAGATPGAGDAAKVVPNLDALFLPAATVAGEWEVIREAPEIPDPELRSHGLQVSAARHYTRYRGPVSEVCSVEIWAFDHSSQARAVADSLDRNDWRILHAEEILILVHGVRMERGVGSRRELAKHCAVLGERTRAGIDREERSGNRAAP